MAKLYESKMLSQNHETFLRHSQTMTFKFVSIIKNNDEQENKP